MIRDELRWELRQTLLARVGGFLRNTLYIPGETCAVCSGPATAEVCGVCASHHEEFGEDLADRVLTLSYVRGNAPTYHQSAFMVRHYKHNPPSEKSAADLALMILAATLIHADCVTTVAGSPWSAVTFIPSTSRPGPEHPVAELARHVAGHTPEQRFLLSLGPNAHDAARVVYRDRFVVQDPYRERVSGQHVLLVDDTWTSGSKAQSAALAVREAGAASVTVLCAARWCRYDWEDHRKLLDRCKTPYDATICPVTGDACPPAADEI